MEEQKGHGEGMRCTMCGCGNCNCECGKSCSCGSGWGMGMMGGKCGCGWHSGHRIFRALLVLIIILCAFWFGVRMGELRATFGGYDYEGMHGYGYPSMMGGYGGYGGYPMMYRWNSGTGYGYGPGMMGSWNTLQAPQATTPAPAGK